VDNLDITKFNKIEHELSICWTNKKRIAVNDKWMNELSNNKYKIYLNKLSYDNDSQDTIVYEGLPIIARINCRKADICNNETFVVKKVNDNNIIISDGGIEKEILIKDFMRLFNPAYCLTVHRVQGSTFQQPFTIYQWKNFDTKMKYTALTRATKMEHVNFA
jgi:ATP-dependent exoDNAse (exonuclease V) alpha subunit